MIAKESTISNEPSLRKRSTIRRDEGGQRLALAFDDELVASEGDAVEHVADALANVDGGHSLLVLSSSLSPEKFDEALVDAVGHLLLNVVPARQSLAVDVEGIVSPDVEKVGRAVRSARAP